MPDVVRTADGEPVDRARPNAVNPADRSSIRTSSSTFPAADASASAYAIGAERDPGDTTTYSTPPSIKPPTAIRAASSDVMGMVEECVSGAGSSREVTKPVCHPRTLSHSPALLYHLQSLSRQFGDQK
jgi:hypothetical protein